MKTESQPQPSPHPEHASADIVIADSNPWVRRDLVKSIRPCLNGRTLAEARSPAEVLTQIGSPLCRVLLIDPFMPTVGQNDGMPLLRNICCLRSDLFILVLVSQPLLLLRDRALPARVAHVYTKTVAPSWLCRFVNEAWTQPHTPGLTVRSLGPAQ